MAPFWWDFAMTNRPCELISPRCPETRKFHKSSKREQLLSVNALARLPHGNECSISRLGEIRASRDRAGRQEIEKFRVPERCRGNELRNEISSFDEPDEKGWLQLVYFLLISGLHLDEIKLPRDRNIKHHALMPLFNVDNPKYTAREGKRKMLLISSFELARKFVDKFNSC